MATKGYKAVLNVGGTELDQAQSVSPSLEADEQDTTARKDDGWRNRQHGIKNMTCDVTALWVPSDTQLAALEDAYFNDTAIACEVLDEDGYGWTGDFRVFSMSRGEDLGDACTVDIGLQSVGKILQVPAGS